MSIHRNIHLEHKYGITTEDYFNLLKKQKGVCKICGNPPSKKDHRKNKEGMYYLHVDHDHITNEIRGLLCNNCNKGLGSFKDNIELLDKAKQYLLNTQDFILPKKYYEIPN